MQTRLTNQKGSIFITTMLSMVLMTIIGGYAFDLTSQSMYFVNRLKKSAQAQFLAEAGLAAAFSTLNADFNSQSDASKFLPTTLGAGTYDAMVTTTGGRTLVSSVGIVDGVSRTVSAEVKGPALSALDYALGGNTVSFTLAGSSSLQVQGDLYSAGNLGLDAQAGSSQIALSNSGDADAGGAVTVTGAGQIQMGASHPNSSLAAFPVVDFAYYQNIAQNGGGLYINGNATYSAPNSMPSPAGGVIFINGNLTTSETQQTTAGIVVTGDVTHTKGTLTIDPANQFPALVTQNGTITINSTGNSNAAHLQVTGLIYSGNNFSIVGNHHQIQVQGSILARGALTGNSGGFSQNQIQVQYESFNIAGISSGATSTITVQSYNS